MDCLSTEGLLSDFMAIILVGQAEFEINNFGSFVAYHSQAARNL